MIDLIFESLFTPLSNEESEARLRQGLQDDLKDMPKLGRQLVERMVAAIDAHPDLKMTATVSGGWFFYIDLHVSVADTFNFSVRVCSFNKPYRVGASSYSTPEEVIAHLLTHGYVGIIKKHDH